MSEDLRRYLKTAIFFLIMWALFCIVLSMVTSCQTSKNVTQKRTERDSLSVMVNDIRFDTRWFEYLRTDSLWQNDYWHYTIYDTSKPVDVETKLPPVLADVRHKKEAGKKVDEKTLQTDTTSAISQTTIEEVCAEEEDSTEDVKREVKTIPIWRVWLFLAFVVFALSMVFVGKDVIYNVTTKALNKILK